MQKESLRILLLIPDLMKLDISTPAMAFLAVSFLLILPIMPS